MGSQTTLSDPDASGYPSNEPGTDAPEAAHTPKALLNFEPWPEEVDPHDLIHDNVRPINVDHVLAVQAGIRANNGYDGTIIVLSNTEDDNGKALKTRELYIFDGHHRQCAIVGYQNPDQGIYIPGLLTTDVDNEALMAVLNPLSVTVYNFREVFESRLDFLKAQFRVNSGRRNIADNAADASASIFQMLAEGASPAALKEIVGKSAAWISNAKLAHENCVEELKTAVREGLVSGKTMIEARNVTKSNQKKMLREILKETRDLPEKDARRVERSIANRVIAKEQAETGGTPKFPGSFGRKQFCSEMHQTFIDFEGSCAAAELDIDTVKPDPEAPHEMALFQRGLLQGMLLAHRVTKADRPTMALKTLKRTFKELTGNDLADPDANDF